MKDFFQDFLRSLSFLLFFLFLSFLGIETEKKPIILAILLFISFSFAVFSEMVREKGEEKKEEEGEKEKEIIKEK